MSIRVRLALLYAMVLPAAAFAQWNCTSTACTFTGAVGIGTSSAPFPLTVSTGTDRVLNFRGDPVSFGLPPTLAGPLIESVNSAQNAVVPMTFFASGFSFMGGNVGIGTTSPQYSLDVSGPIASEGLLGLYSNGPNPYSFTIRNTAGGTDAKNWVPLSVNGNQLVSFVVNDANTIPTIYQTVTRNGYGISSVTFPSGNVGIGTTNPQYLLSVSGTMGAKEVIVTKTGWSDYVFQPEYRLKPLTEVAAYMREHHHLPEIPSAKEVEEHGVSLGEMQAKLLAKIEELTLHMIDADQRISHLERENQELQTRNRSLQQNSASPTPVNLSGGADAK